MARQLDVRIAFVNAIKIDLKLGQVVTAADFVRELEKVNHHWSLRQANEWIERYQGFFRDYTDHEGDNRVYFMLNMGYVK